MAVGREPRSAGRDPVEAAGKLFPHVPAQMLERLLRAFGYGVGAAPESTDTVGKPTRTPVRPVTG
ncbi:hypothetical protein AB0D11_10550 [Streptomyces monashensis]|uniref:hypothetical protein n=1 Tax=Streptomyces monashensis TaxID=1678012 RepID=UPI0033CE30D0